jgi:rfaE bifunctional protein nucleotidyltransferase chain/domain
VKIHELDSLSQIIEIQKTNGNKIVGLCHGVFDILHYGHIEYFKFAKSKCDLLVVSVTSDRYVGKGPKRPFFNEEIRMKTLEAIDCIDFVCLSNNENSVKVISLIKPNAYFKGNEYAIGQDLSGNLELESREVKKHNGQIIFSEGIVFSSSRIINNTLMSLPDETKKWLKEYSKMFSNEDFVSTLDKVKKLKILVIGEAIQDEYVDCEVLGKTSKSHIVAFKEINQESHLGGTLSIVNHISQFVESVSLFSATDFKKVSDEKMSPNLNTNIVEISKLKSEIIKKRRYLNHIDKSKLFEVYSTDFIDIGFKERETIKENIIDLLPNYDLVIVADYGHGLIDDELAQILCENSSYLCLNVQSNAGNRGLNTISKYKKANYVCINGDELFLETKKQNLNIYEAASEISNTMGLKYLTITNGKEGLLIFDAKEKRIFELPALTNQVKDRVGAGDALFATTSIFSYFTAAVNIGFFGNVAGANAVSHHGNNWVLRKEDFIKQIEYLLKF